MRNVSKKYDKEVLRIAHLTLQKGLIYGVIGPSGAGKSTLLRIINLLTLPDQGSILFKGLPISENRKDRLAVQRSMGLVFQKTLLFRDTVWGNIAYGLKARGLHKADVNKRVGRLLEQVGLSELAQRRADTLSGGEAQRVAIARAVAYEPELLLLDEPTANLDPRNVELIEKMILTLNKERNITVVMVTHNIFQARRIAHEVIYIDEGEIIEMASKETLFSQPAHEKTRLYIEGRTIY